MDDLLKEAIAVAKAVRETALANAKMALEEAFTPRLKSMLAKKIQHEIEDEDGDEEVTEDAPLEDEDDEVVPSEEPSAPVSEEDELSDEDDEVEPVAAISDEDEEEPVAEEDEMSDEDEEEPVAEETDEDDETVDELDLEAILRELEEDDEEVSEEYEDEDTEDGHEEVSENDVSSEIGDADNKVKADAADSSDVGQGSEEPSDSADAPAGKENEDDEVVENTDKSTDDPLAPPQEDAVTDVEEDIDLEEVLKALSEEDDEEADVEQIATLKKEVKEHRDVVKYLRSKLNEVNLLNAKLLFTNKLFRAYGLSNEQKMKVVETFDRTKNLREIKLVFSTLAESFGQTKSKPIQESKGSSSKAVASTKPSKKVITEGDSIKARFKKLANII